MGIELEQCRALDGDFDPNSRPRILCVGAAGVGKATIANRLRQSDRGAMKTPGEGIACFSWKIDTKYYTADVGIWTARLEEEENDAVERLQLLDGQCDALVMVFDLSNDPSFDCLKNWASRADLTGFEILLCVGNKADRLPQHYGHVEYRRRLQKRGESSSDPHPEFLEFGIERSEGSSLLNDEDAEPGLRADDKKGSRIEWCIDNGIEYVEACALNDVFDECLSLDGDLQGVSRVRGALSAHMWPGMVMKPNPGKAGTETETRDVSSDEESDFTIEYELLSSFSDDEASFPESGGQASDSNGHGPVAAPATDAGTGEEVTAGNRNDQVAEGDGSSRVAIHEEVVADCNGQETGTTPSGNKDDRLDEFEQLMQEMAGMRENLGTMPDAQRRDVAAQIAMRMASMFIGDDDSDDE